MRTITAGNPVLVEMKHVQKHLRNVLHKILGRGIHMRRTSLIALLIIIPCVGSFAGPVLSVGDKTATGAVFTSGKCTSVMVSSSPITDLMIVDEMLRFVECCFRDSLSDT